MRKNGKIAFWNDEKAYGFIEPDGAGKRVFVHINSLASKRRAPQIGEAVSYRLSKDDKGRPCAVDVYVAGEGNRIKKRKKKPKSNSTILYLIPLYIFALAISSFFVPTNWLILAWQCVLSFIAYFMYRSDKHAAVKDYWRTPENSLHLVSLIGGWPGALYAKKSLRHKSSKLSFRIVFWFTVLISLASVYWLNTNEGIGLLESLKSLVW